MSKAIKVRLVTHEGYGDHLFLGPIRLCNEASDWLRKKFPQGGTFRQAWDACRDQHWLAYVARELHRLAGDRVNCPCAYCTWADNVDDYRSKVLYERVEKWLHKVMAGRPEVISTKRGQPC